jgi:putative DNA primase/helicase
VSLRLLPPQPRDDSWRSRLLRGDKHQVRAIVTNLACFLQHHPALAGSIVWDAFAERIAITRELPWERDVSPATRRPVWSEEDTARLIDWLARNEDWHVKASVVNETLPVVARTREIHPPRAYLASLRWDETERLPTWLSVYCGAQASPYSAEAGVRWLISAVARVMVPGCQADGMLILESPEQGTGKSSAFRALVPDVEWHSETGITVGDKDSYQSLHGVWIHVFDELDAMRRGDVTRLKSFLTARKDHYRPPYARLARDFPRQNVFAGTTNEAEYFQDRTGNRRFLPVRVTGQVDVGALERDRDQLWAEAFARFHQGWRWHADTPSVRALFEDEQAGRVQADDWEPRIAHWLARPTVTGWEQDTPGGPPRKTTLPYDASAGVLTLDVLVYAIGKPAERITTRDTMRAADCLRSLGYERGPKRRENGAEVRRYLTRPAKP